MTTIAAASVDGVHALAADGRGMCGYEIQGGSRPKLVPYGKAVIGCAGSGEAVEIVESLPREDPGHLLHTPGDVLAFAAAVKQRMKASGWEVTKEERSAPDYGASFLYLSGAGIWRVYGRLSTAKMDADHPLAIGNGMEYAIGAMEAMTSAGVSPVVLPAQEIVALAVRVAMKRDAGTGGKIMLALRGGETFGPEWV
jgi:ATP-dependent protease HslVU (ClpYQ) peptidase subunit